MLEYLGLNEKSDKLVQMIPFLNFERNVRVVVGPNSFDRNDDKPPEIQFPEKPLNQIALARRVRTIADIVQSRSGTRIHFDSFLPMPMTIDFNDYAEVKNGCYFSHDYGGYGMTNLDNEKNLIQEMRIRLLQKANKHHETNKFSFKCIELDTKIEYVKDKVMIKVDDKDVEKPLWRIKESNFIEFPRYVSVQDIPVIIGIGG